jgi:hypothetical protein
VWQPARNYAMCKNAGAKRAFRILFLAAWARRLRPLRGFFILFVLF